MAWDKPAAFPETAQRAVPFYAWGMSSRRTTGTVLCRTCANWLGRANGPERRGSSRNCSAGLVTAPWVFECESYVRLSDMRPARSAAHRLVPAKTRA